MEKIISTWILDVIHQIENPGTSHFAKHFWNKEKAREMMFTDYHIRGNLSVFQISKERVIDDICLNARKIYLTLSRDIARHSATFDYVIPFNRWGCGYKVSLSPSQEEWQHYYKVVLSVVYINGTFDKIVLKTITPFTPKKIK